MVVSYRIVSYRIGWLLFGVHFQRLVETARDEGVARDVDGCEFIHG